MESITVLPNDWACGDEAALERLFSLRFLVGCTAEETAELTGLSKATVDRKVKLARAWLFQRLRPSIAS